MHRARVYGIGWETGDFEPFTHDFYFVALVHNQESTNRVIPSCSALYLA